VPPGARDSPAQCGYGFASYLILMMPSKTPDKPRSRASIAPALLLAGLAAIALGLLLPLLVGSFSHQQALVLAIVEAACLTVVALGVIVMARRLRESHEALWSLARRDELTGVGNYRSLHERLAEEIARHRRHDRRFALILLDLDGFKQINERYGHLEGDRLLAEVGAALRDEVRGEDPIFRQGGDEFAVIVEETDAEEAAEVAARVRARVTRRGFGSDERLPLGGATGIAIYPDDGLSAEDLLGCADDDLFAAKRGVDRA
jgi:diguanylate cyclase (GGDEF)-like protein